MKSQTEGAKRVHFERKKKLHNKRPYPAEMVDQNPEIQGWFQNFETTTERTAKSPTSLFPLTKAPVNTLPVTESLRTTEVRQQFASPRELRTGYAGRSGRPVDSLPCWEPG